MGSDLRSALQRELFPLPEGWRWHWVDEVMTIQGGAQPPSETFLDHFEPGYVRFIQIRDFDDDNHLTFIKDGPKWRKCSVNDVLIARYGASLGRILRGKEGAYNVALAKVIPLNADLNFLYYLLKSDFFQVPLAGVGARSVQSGFNKSDLSTIPVPIPPLHEQRGIAYILGTLDEKIELNRRMNETLEAIVWALFKLWFVIFGPVRAKAEGRQPVGVDAETAALFPNEFENSSLGEIPKGWKIGRLDDLLILQRGYDLPADQRIPGLYPIISASGPSGTHSEYKVAGPGVVTGRSGLLGKVFFVHENFWPLNTSLYIKEYRASRPVHAYHILNTLDFEVFNVGSAVPMLNRNHVHSLSVAVPPLAIVQAFEDKTMPFLRYCYQNEQQSQTLASIRDTLLPKLLSGEIHVKEAEKLVEAKL